MGVFTKSRTGNLANLSGGTRMRLLRSRGAFAVRKMVASSCQLSLLKIISLHLALYAAVVGYLALGGMAFLWIEGEAEIAQSNAFVAHLKENWTSIDRLNNANRREEVLIYLRDFLSELKTRKISIDTFIRATEHGRWNSSIESGSRRWTMSSSVLYAFTLLTTIGFRLFLLLPVLFFTILNHYYRLRQHHTDDATRTGVHNGVRRCRNSVVSHCDCRSRSLLQNSRHECDTVLLHRRLEQKIRRATNVSV